MTLTYEKFKKQYYEQGREKADGYDRSHFDGLSDDEKELAFSMLLEEATANPDSIEWMFYLNAKKAEKACLGLIASLDLTPITGEFVLYYYLYKYTKDNKYQELIIKRFPSYPDYELKLALKYIGSTKPTKSLKKFLINTTLNDHYTISVRKTAARYYLLANNVPCETKAEQEIFFQYIDGLISEDKEIINSILTDLGKSFA